MRSRPQKDQLREIMVGVGDERFALLTCGDEDAPLVMCLHGFPDCPWSYAKVLRELADAGYRGVAPWMRGYAPSPTTGPKDVNSVAADVRGLLDALHVERAFVVGHDWGSPVTVALMSENPERVRAAVLMSVPHPATFVKRTLRSPMQWIRSSYMLAFQVPVVPDRLLAARDLAGLRALWKVWFPTTEPDDEYWQHWERTMRASFPAPLGYYRAMAGQLGSVGRSPRIETPVLYLHGDADRCVSASIAAGQEIHFDRRFRAETLPGLGHFLQLEAPDDIARRIVQWARAHS